MEIGQAVAVFETHFGDEQYIGSGLVIGTGFKDGQIVVQLASAFDGESRIRAVDPEDCQQIEGL